MAALLCRWRPNHKAKTPLSKATAENSRFGKAAPAREREVGRQRGMRPRGSNCGSVPRRDSEESRSVARRVLIHLARHAVPSPWVTESHPSPFSAALSLSPGASAGLANACRRRTWLPGAGGGKLRPVGPVGTRPPRSSPPPAGQAPGPPTAMDAPGTCSVWMLRCQGGMSDAVTSGAWLTLEGLPVSPQGQPIPEHSKQRAWSKPFTCKPPVHTRNTSFIRLAHRGHSSLTPTLQGQVPEKEGQPHAQSPQK